MANHSIMSTFKSCSIKSSNEIIMSQMSMSTNKHRHFAQVCDWPRGHRHATPLIWDHWTSQGCHADKQQPNCQYLPSTTTNLPVNSFLYRLLCPNQGTKNRRQWWKMVKFVLVTTPDKSQSAHAEGLDYLKPITEEFQEKTVLIMPLFHAFGSLVTSLPTLRMGGCLAILPKFESESFVNALQVCSLTLLILIVLYIL